MILMVNLCPVLWRMIQNVIDFKHQPRILPPLVGDFVPMNLVSS